ISAGQFRTFATWGNFGTVPYEGTGNQLSRNRRGPTSWSLAIMERRNGALCRAGRVAEADSHLHRRSDRKDRARRGCCIQPGGNRRIHQVACVHVTRIGLETGATSTWLWTELNKLGLPVICIDARHAKAALIMQINKSDRNDAVGIARIMQCGWYKEVRVKD